MAVVRERSQTFRITDNLKQVEKELKRKQRKHIPEATRWALNNTAKKVVNALKAQTEKRLDRPIPFTVNAYAIQFAKKTNLQSSIFIKDIQAKYLQWVIDGGVNAPGRKIAVPTRQAKLNKYGNIPGKRTGLIKGKKEFRKTKTGVGVWTIGKNPQLLIVLKDSITYTKKLLPFFRIGEGVVSNVLPKQLRLSLKKEMSKK